MKMLTDTLEDAKTAHALGATTAGTGFVTFIEMIPAEIGKVGILIGIILSMTAIYFNFKRNKREVTAHLLLLENDRRAKDEHELKMKLLRKEVAGS